MVFEMGGYQNGCSSWCHVGYGAGSKQVLFIKHPLTLGWHIRICHNRNRTPIAKLAEWHIENKRSSSLLLSITDVIGVIYLRLCIQEIPFAQIMCRRQFLIDSQGQWAYTCLCERETESRPRDRHQPDSQEAPTERQPKEANRHDDHHDPERP